MLIKEYRIPLPLSLEEYRVAQIYMIDKKSRTETHGAHKDAAEGDSKSGIEARTFVLLFVALPLLSL